MEKRMFENSFEPDLIILLLSDICDSWADIDSVADTCELFVATSW